MIQYETCAVRLAIKPMVQLRVNCLVSALDRNISFAQGLERDLLLAAGESVQVEASQYAPATYGSLFQTNTGALKVSALHHAIVYDLDTLDTGSYQRAVQACLFKVVELASREAYATVAICFPGELAFEHELQSTMQSLMKVFDQHHSILKEWVEFQILFKKRDNLIRAEDAVDEFFAKKREEEDRRQSQKKGLLQRFFNRS